jgi:isopenicillin N synthase-like dioxygenase
MTAANGLADFAQIPAVDVSGLLSADPAQQQAVADELGRAAREVGFLYVTGHGIPAALFDDLLTVTQQFFALSYEEKMRVYIGNSTNHRGYVPEGEEVFSGGTRDKKEAFDLALELPADDPDYLRGNRLLGPNQWPAVPDMATVVNRYYAAVLELGHVLLRGFAMALNESPDTFTSYVTKPPSQLRLVHYPEDLAASDSVGIGAHTDYELFTLLRPTKPGLEVLNGAGTWVDVPVVPDAFVVNIGDLFETWTNGVFVATTHRVRKVTEERYSFPLFYNVDFDTLVAPLPKFVRPGEPALPALRAGEHLFAQTAQSFSYLRERLADGALALPDGSLALSSFGRQETAGS